MKRRDWFKCFLALPFISVLKAESKTHKTPLPTPPDNYLSPRDMATRHTLRPHPTPTPSCTLNRCGTRCEPCAEDQYIIYGSPKVTYYKIERQYIYKKNRPKFNG